LAEAGAGIAQLPEYIVRRALQEQRLLRLLPEYEPSDLGIYSLYPHNRFLAASTHRR